LNDEIQSFGDAAMDADKSGSVEIRHYLSADYVQFKRLFGVYFKSDFGIDLSGEQLEKVCSEIARQAGDSVLHLDLLLIGGDPNGFIIYQIDSPQSDWCEKEGYGFIREVYVAQTVRKRGLGTKLVAHAEYNLHKLGAKAIYLTGEGSTVFWMKNGYASTGETSSINHDPIFVKTI
jgi:GNAT superfamily N-acetyltransferase